MARSDGAVICKLPVEVVWADPAPPEEPSLFLALRSDESGFLKSLTPYRGQSVYLQFDIIGDGRQKPADPWIRRAAR